MRRAAKTTIWKEARPYSVLSLALSTRRRVQRLSVATGKGKERNKGLFWW
jgi:hypothetical protein